MYSATPADPVSVSRPMVKILFLASCLLAIVSWYTTFEGMRLYLSVWFSALASIGVQTALVLVAWLIGFSSSSGRANRRPIADRGLCHDSDRIGRILVRQSVHLVQRARAAGRDRAQALRCGERIRGSSSDAAHVRDRRATEACAGAGRTDRGRENAWPHLARTGCRSLSGECSCGCGGRGPHLLRRTTRKVPAKASGIRRSTATPSSRGNRSVRCSYRSGNWPITWPRASRSIPPRINCRRIGRSTIACPGATSSRRCTRAGFQKPAVPVYGDFVDRTVSGQEDLLVAFEELFTAPTPRHGLRCALAMFIDVVVFLLAFASGPYFFGADEHRWISGGAALEGIDQQIFTRDFLRKLTPGPRGMARVEVTSAYPRRATTLPAAGRQKTRGGYRRRRQEILHAGTGHPRASARIAGVSGFSVARRFRR